MKRLLPLYFLTLFIAPVFAQVFNFLEIPVIKNGQQLANPWTGGMNAPQWSKFDINNDGVEDLYAFDRNGSVHLSFINMGNSPGAVNYKYSRFWLKNFPQVKDFVLMRDFNNDGLSDMFANAYDEFHRGMKVYKASLEDDFLNFERILFPSYSSDIIPYQENGEIIDQIRIWIPLNYPAIEDMDNDGDLDILAMGQLGDKVVFYKNISIENGYSTDTLLYELNDDCWGRFGLMPDSLNLTLSSSIDMCAFFNAPENVSEKNNFHGGSTINFFDIENDGDKEILYGDLISPNIILGTNGGNEDKAWVTEQDTIFPSYNTPINIPFLPATFLLDINNDNKKDLLASPNQIIKTPDVETVWFYENIGTEDVSEFQFVQNDFLAGGMLDFGTGANPVFVDVNADGLFDLVIGNESAWADGMGAASLNLLINSGTADSPAFELVDEDWLGLGQFFPEVKAICPAFGDLDNDGDNDLLIGDFEGNLHYAENIAGQGNPMEFGDFIFNWEDIDVGNFATPFIYDINEDELPDLIIGELKGTVNYFPNIGSLDNPIFHPIAEEAPNNDYFGKINTQPPGVAAGYSQPTILEFGEKKYLFSGSFNGWLHKYEINTDSIESGAFELLSDRLGEIREGRITRLFLENINNDNFIDAVIGNDRGGLTVFQTPITVNGITEVVENEFKNELDFNIFPNPVFKKLNIESEGCFNVHIINVFGQVVYSKPNLNHSIKIDIADMSPGVYFVSLKKEEISEIEKIIISK